MKVVNLVCISLENLIDLAFYDFGREYCSLKVDCVCEVHLTVIEKIVRAYKRFYCFLHGLNVKVILGEKILVWPLSTPISCIKIVTNFLACQNSNIFWKNCVKHRTILNSFMRVMLFQLFRVVRGVWPQFKRDYISHRWDSLVSSSCSCVIFSRERIFY